MPIHTYDTVRVRTCAGKHSANGMNCETTRQRTQTTSLAPVVNRRPKVMAYNEHRFSRNGQGFLIFESAAVSRIKRISIRTNSKPCAKAAPSTVR
jgi:hypothetical protein